MKPRTVELVLPLIRDTQIGNLENSSLTTNLSVEFTNPRTVVSEEAWNLSCAIAMLYYISVGNDSGLYTIDPR